MQLVECHDSNVFNLPVFQIVDDSQKWYNILATIFGYSTMKGRNKLQHERFLNNQFRKLTSEQQEAAIQHVVSARKTKINYELVQQAVLVCVGAGVTLVGAGLAKKFKLW